MRIIVRNNDLMGPVEEWIKYVVMLAKSYYKQTEGHSVHISKDGNLISKYS